MWFEFAPTIITIEMLCRCKIIVAKAVQSVCWIARALQVGRGLTWLLFFFLVFWWFLCGIFLLLFCNLFIQFFTCVFAVSSQPNASSCSCTAGLPHISTFLRRYKDAWGQGVCQCGHQPQGHLKDKTDRRTVRCQSEEEAGDEIMILLSRLYLFWE